MFKLQNNFESYCWVSPAIDLIHLLYLWIDDSLRLEYREEILYRYHLEFKESLTKLNCVKKIPSLLDLQLELLKAGPYGKIIIEFNKFTIKTNRILI